MVAPPVTEDYYLILEVEQNATTQLIVSSYRRLALKLHPDRNAKHDATEAFQRLGRAYETLNDETKRRAYDLTYPSIRQSRQTPRPTSTASSSSSSSSSTPQAGTPSEAAQITALQKAKQERSVRWRTRKSIFDSTIFDLQRRIRQLEQAIKNLDSISAAEAAADAQKNSWATWFLSPIYKKVEESQEEKEQKSRERQERRIEKDMKERRLQSLNADLKAQEKSLQQAREEVEAADRCDDEKIRVIEARISARKARERLEREREQRERWVREARERQERERQERERQAREWNERERQRLEKERQQQQQREKQERELREKLERERQEKLAAFLRRQQQAQNPPSQQRQNRARQAGNAYTHSPHTSTSCQHHGWWPKVHGRTNCPNCNETWTYLLECPGCKMKRCPKCQAAIRRARQNRRAHSPPRRVRTPSPDYLYHYDW